MLQTKRKRDEDQSDLIAVSDGCQSIFTNKFAGNQAVGNIIKLLEDNTSKQWKTEAPEDGFRLSYSKILIHA